MIDSAFVTAGYTIEFSANLNKLFRLQSVKTDDYWEQLIFSANPTTYGSITCDIVNGLGWSVDWFPFHQILIESDLKLKKIQIQDNIPNSASFFTTNYKNVILEFSITNSNPNEIYPNFEYITQSSNNKFVYFENDEDLEQVKNISISLYNITKRVTIPYTLKYGEFINLKLRLFETR